MNNPLVDGDFHTDRGLAHVGLQNLDGMEEGFPMLRAMVDVNTCEYKRGSIAVVGRNRTGSGATLQSLKNEIDKCIMSGVTEIIVDGCFYSLDQRSYLKTPHNPSWFPFLGGHFKELCNYAARMQELMHGVVFSRPVAVFSPAPAIRAVYHAHERGRNGLSRRRHSRKKRSTPLSARALISTYFPRNISFHAPLNPRGNSAKPSEKAK
jgi:hypothetical protein